MDRGSTFEALLDAEVVGDGADPRAAAVARAMTRMAEAAVSLSTLIAAPPLGGRLGAAAGSANSDGDGQRRLDLVAEDLFAGALREAGIGAYLSEEVEAASVFDARGLVAVAIDPLDGSSNIDVNAPIGTIFSIFPMPPEAVEAPALAFRQTGRAQLAAGFFVYGPQTSLVVSFGQGVHLFVLNEKVGEFILVESDIKIPVNVPEYAINASNYRHWHEPVQSYIDDCVQGEEGPTGRNFNMRWIASLVADSYRIFMRGGIFLYPGDKRPGYEQGRLRLLYEANPVAFLAEQAGGAATDGIDLILDRKPHSPHQRVPFIMGSADKVERVRKYYLDLSPPNRDAPLFGRRGLLRG
jgi:fructose-1,6-bisphosphatase I